MRVQNLARQGDLLFVRIKDIPQGARRCRSKVLAEGEVTGHYHRVVGGGAAVMEIDPMHKYVDVRNECTVTHDEHGTVTLGPGRWEVRRQREYQPDEIRVVAD